MHYSNDKEICMQLPGPKWGVEPRIINILEDEFQWVEKVKYLGITLNKRHLG